jgi:hypothetical protein
VSDASASQSHQTTDSCHLGYPEAWSAADDQLPPSILPDDTNEMFDGNFTPTPTVSLFLLHFSSSCSNHPSNYPTILLLLATLPATILPRNFDTLSILFDSFWSPWIKQDRSLLIGGYKAIGELVAAFTECLLWEIGGLMKSSKEDKIAKELIEIQLVRIWRGYLGIDVVESGSKRSRGLSSDHVVILFKTCLEKLASKYSSEFKISVGFLGLPDQVYTSELFDIAWSQVCDVSLSILTSSDSTLSLPLLSSALISFTKDSIPSLIESSQTLAIASTLQACKNLNGTESSDDFERRIPPMEFIFALRERVEEDAKTLGVSPVTVVYWIESVQC